jgi:clan AA aspartic protease
LARGTVIDTNGGLQRPLFFITFVIFNKANLAPAPYRCDTIKPKEEHMIVYTDITLKNGTDVDDAIRGRIEEHEITQTTVQAMVDTGAWTMIINEETRKKLGLLDKGYENGTLADGTKERYKLAGPIEIWWENRSFICPALVIPDAPDILLGAIPLEAMDLTINPYRGLVGVHGDIVMHRV